MNRTAIVCAFIGSAAIAISWVVSGCDPLNPVMNAGSDDGADAANPFCTPEIIDAGVFGALCDGGFEAGPGGGGTGEIDQIFVKVIDVTGKCVGKATTDNKCTLTPSDYTATVSYVAPAPGQPSAVGALFNRAVNAPDPYCGAATSNVRATQPAASGTKLCPPAVTPAPCSDFKGMDEIVPWSILADIEGGSGESTMIKFKVSHPFQEPSACTDHSFAVDSPENTVFVPLSPSYSFGALRTTEVTLTGNATFQIANQGLVGSVNCDYTVKIRPTDSTGK